MRIIKRGALEQFWRRHPDAKASLEAWYGVVRKANWKTPAELKQVYHNADLVGRRTVFNIAGNKYRLIARVNYRRLLGRTLPHVLHTDEECERLTNELLPVLIDEYEQRRYPIAIASPRQTLQHLMEARQLTQKDLWKIFGSKGITSEVFHGKRSISKTQAKKLAAFFHVGADLFI